MSVQTSSVDLNAASVKHHIPAMELNAGDANPPSRPGKITTTVFVSLLTLLLLYMNWKSVKGFFGLD